MRSISFDSKNDVVEVRKSNEPFVFLNKDSRDCLISANTFLIILRDTMNDLETKVRIEGVVGHISDMLYGFEVDNGH